MEKDFMGSSSDAMHQKKLEYSSKLKDCEKDIILYLFKKKEKVFNEIYNYPSEENESAGVCVCFMNHRYSEVAWRLEDGRLMDLLQGVRVYVQDLNELDLNPEIKQSYSVLHHLLQRNLVNIEMNAKHFDQTKYNEFIEVLGPEGFKPFNASYHTVFYEKNNELPPNLSIFGRLPYRFSNVETEISGFVNVMFIYGFAADSLEQPDVKIYAKICNGKAELTEKAKQYLENLFCNIFAKIRKCMDDEKLDYAYMPGIGLNAFLKVLSEDSKKCVKEIYWNCFLNQAKKYGKYQWLLADNVNEYMHKEEYINVHNDFGYIMGKNFVSFLDPKKSEKFFNSLEKLVKGVNVSKRSSINEAMGKILIVCPSDHHAIAGNENVPTSFEGCIGENCYVAILNPWLNGFFFNKTWHFFVKNS